MRVSAHSSWPDERWILWRAAGLHRLALYVGTGDCCLTVLDARHGEPLGIGKETWLRPRHSDTALGLVLLDAAGLPARCAPRALPAALGGQLAGAAGDAAHRPTAPASQ